MFLKTEEAVKVQGSRRWMPGRTPVEHCRHDCHINAVQGTGFCTSESTCAAACQHRTDDLVAAAVILSTPAGAVARSERPEQMSARRRPSRPGPSSAVIANAQMPSQRPAVSLASAPTTPLRTQAEPKGQSRCAVQYHRCGIYWAAAVASERACLTFVTLAWK
jgi:hypothetical protein